MSCQPLAEYIADPSRRSALCETTGAHPQWLYQVAAGWNGKRASKTLALAIEHATGGAVSRHDLRPDVFGPAPSEPQKARVA